MESAEDYIDLINHIPGGVSIFHFRDGHAYLDYANDGCLEVHHIARKDISALIGSQTMPLMDGLQAAVNIRHCDKPDAKTVPIIAMTANAFDEDVEKSRAAGMNAHLSKPIDPEYMYVVLDHVINHS